ncbi:four helix bundle protein [Eubacterium maltosivorans]|uniref:Four helix bundle protein n=1 Tax=Eubacterium maltosivorans TaxID=2041044 RepID=A0A4P9C8D1_EUBML|nr:four helix bundle protein [Eubacterium maltosivorans]QCT71828.1 four helix bundle protein [Eubacterium maltosivorans]WPK82090.1 hypothetical protein EUMA32_35510 [Eubacterium maltosivorans]SDP64932.1 four helix bundle protein [Eubacterium maltosivorans]
MSEITIKDKSYTFAVRVIRCYQHLQDNKREFVLSKQLLRSGTSIGANVREAQQAQSRKDFLSKMSIALKEASETQYWLDLLMDTGYLEREKCQELYNTCDEICKMLTSIIKTTRKSMVEI